VTTELKLHIPPLDGSESMHIRRATAEDAERIAEIYNWYILNTVITFETEVVSPEQMTKRIQKNSSTTLAGR